MWWPGLEPTSKLWNCGRLPSSLSFHICKMETQTVYPSSRIARTPLNDIGENQGSQWPCPALIHCSRSLAEGQDEALDAARLRTFAWFFPPWQHLSPSRHPVSPLPDSCLHPLPPLSPPCLLGTLPT